LKPAPPAWKRWKLLRAAFAGIKMGAKQLAPLRLRPRRSYETR